ncbi:MAG: hypothetical protein Q4F00_01540 [bacterium]|nr:hypothetical protein [bacterium]
MKKTLFASIIAAISAASLFVIPSSVQADPPAEGQTPKAQVQCNDKGDKEAAPKGKKCPGKSMKHQDKKHHAHRGHRHPGAPSSERELKRLTEKLDLNADQQAKIGKILKKNEENRKQEMQKERQKMKSEREARMKKMKAEREAEAKEIEKLLNADQKAKFTKMRAEQQKRIEELKKNRGHKGPRGHKHHGKRPGGPRPDKNAAVKAPADAAAKAPAEAPAKAKDAAEK